MALFRKIVVDEKIFEWKYSFDDYDWQMPSHLVFRSEDKSLKIIVYFCSDKTQEIFQIGKCPFQTGLDAVKDGTAVTINLNQPRFAAEMLHYLLKFRIEEGAKGVLHFKDGTDILRTLGYQFTYYLGKNDRRIMFDRKNICNEK